MSIEKCGTRYFVLSAVSAAAALVMAGCSGGGSDDDDAQAADVAISGVVADGPIQGAKVCYDLDDNRACDAADPTSAPTDADGRYSITVPAARAGQHAVVVEVPATAVDKDTGAAVGAAFVLVAPATGSNGAQTVFVSPLTTMVATIARRESLENAAAVSLVQQQLVMAASPLADFVAGNDVPAARLAAALNRVQLDARAQAEAGGASAADARLLAEAVAADNLPALGALAAAASGTPAQAAAGISTAVLAQAGVGAGSAAAQAQWLSRLAAPLRASAIGPFVSVRDFRYADGSNYSYRVFVGDSAQTDSQGRFVAHELRKAVAGGVEQRFNRNTAYWTGSQWAVCEREWEVTLGTNQTDAATGTSVYCGGSKSSSRIVSDDISGRRMADVVAEMRAFPLQDSDGLPLDWGPAPEALGNATFPAGSSLSTRRTTGEIGSTDSYGLLTKVSVRDAEGYRRHLAGFDDDDVDPASVRGNWADASLAVNGGNALFLEEYASAQPPDSTLAAVTRWLFAPNFGVDDKVRFYKCTVVAATNAEGSCSAAGEGALGPIETRGNARLRRFALGYPAELIGTTRRARFLIERDGALLRGITAFQRTTYNQRLNTTAWIALRDALGIAPHAEPAAPAGPGPFVTLRSFTFTDANNYSWRAFNGDSSAIDAQGIYLINEQRQTRSGGVLQPFVRNRLYWTGSDWYYCPDDGTGIIRQNNAAPFASVFCNSYEDESFSRTDITLDGRIMSEVVRDFRRYGSKDGGTFEYRNWGPDQNVHTQLAGASFPAGSVMQVRSSVRKATPEGIANGPNDRVRVAPADTSQPFDTWPFAASLDEMIAKYPGDYFGATPSGSRTFGVASYNLPAAPAPEYTTQVRIRVAFDADGRKARFYRAYVAAATGSSTAFERLIDTTYTVETLGNAQVLKFAAMPDGFVERFGYERRFAQINGAVWYAFKDSVTGAPLYSLRLNGTARVALFGTLGIQ